MIEQKFDRLEEKQSKLVSDQLGAVKQQARMQMIKDLCDVNRQSHHKWLELLNQLNKNYTISITAEKLKIENHRKMAKYLDDMIAQYIKAYESGESNHQEYL